MKKTMLKRMTVAAACMMAAAACQAGGPWLRGMTDKCPIDYRAGEQMTFTLTLERADSLPPGLTVDWVRTGDDGKREEGKAPAIPDSPIIVKTSLDRAGFVRIHAVLRCPDGKPWAPDGVTVKKDRAGNLSGSVFFDGGAGADVDSIRQGAPEPADFDAFWARHKAELAKVPMDGAKCEELPSRNGKVRIFIVTVPCAGPKPATGYLIVPTKAGKFPAEISFHGYGSSWSKHATQAPDGTRENGNALKLALSAHGFELNREAAYYKAERDLAEFDAELLEHITYHPVSTVDEVIDLAVVSKEQPAEKSQKGRKKAAAKTADNRAEASV